MIRVCYVMLKLKNLILITEIKSKPQKSFKSTCWYLKVWCTLASVHTYFLYFYGQQCKLFCSPHWFLWCVIQTASWTVVNEIILHIIHEPRATWVFYRLECTPLQTFYIFLLNRNYYVRAGSEYRVYIKECSTIFLLG